MRERVLSSSTGNVHQSAPKFPQSYRKEKMWISQYASVSEFCVDKISWICIEDALVSMVLLINEELGVIFEEYMLISLRTILVGLLIFREKKTSIS